ncbi:antirepressor protein KilAC domain [Vibrio phage PVP-XSN]|uniref:Antirepressor protein KilAC domain n=1 Tax=Vibrio phage PVP-XSN TaxID=3056214 RepID=A0AAX3Y3J2_9CAUD|nr:antirepressor protein KilAC domain [Vibrio phage PVP-XSN]
MVMSNLIPFSFNNLPVRVIEQSGEPWFVAKDVAEILGYVNTSKAVNSHCKNVYTCPTEMGGQVRRVQIIPERDVYRLVMRSKLPEAEKFEEWVVSDVLPSIRKTGTYSASSMPNFNNPAEAARAWADEYEKNLIAQQKLEQADQEVQRLQGVCHTIAAQFSPGMTPAAFCRQLNGVNVQQVQNHLAKKGMLIRDRGFKASSYYRDNWFAEKQESPTEGVVTNKVILTRKGAVSIYKLYLKGDLPMKANWDGSHTHCLFEDQEK